MPFSIKDRSYFGLTVNGTDLQLGADTVASATVIEDVKAIAPTVSAHFLDNKLISNGLGLFQDGVPISLVIGDGKSGNPNTFAFRQWSLDDGTINSGGNSAELHGVADALPWLSKVITKAYKGPASSVVTQLAGEAGINLTDVDTTNDSMTWLPDGRAIGHFVRNLVDRAWIGSGSVPHLAVTSQNGQWMVRLKDIMKQNSLTQNFTSAGLPGAGTTDIPIHAFNIRSKGGPLNNQTSYGHKIVQEMLNGQVNVWQNLTFNSLASVLGINSSLQGMLSNVRTFYHPADQGNTHKNYAQALHQNRMGRSTFSTILSILTDYQTSVKLMDDVQVKLANSDGSQNQAYSGTYKVTGISRHMTKSTYVEKVTLSGQGSSAQ